jgi:hypothetical protein
MGNFQAGKALCARVSKLKVCSESIAEELEISERELPLSKISEFDAAYIRASDGFPRRY